MSKGDPDPNQEAARLVDRATRGAPEEMPADLEAAWEAWSGRIQGCDERTMTLLRAAFEAGAASSNAGRVRGAKAGGAARAAKLSDRRRKAIARKAAKARWKEPKD